MPAKEYNEVKMRGILPSDGMDAIPVTESAPLTSIQVEPKPNAGPIPVGKIPDGASQIIRTGQAINEISVFYTVSAGKVLYLAYYQVFLSNTSGASASLNLRIRDDGDVFWANIAFHYHPLDFVFGYSGNFMPPLEIPENYDIYVSSERPLTSIVAVIHGYEM